MKIRELFDTTKPIDRRIEKVITYDLTEEKLLKQEVEEYVATESIEEHIERLLDLLDAGMSGNTVTDTGVWVSGFYGSGKSSFTKYLGFALDPNRRIEGKPFLEYLQVQLKSLPVRQRLATVAKRHPTTVVMLDLASQDMAGTNVISSVLYWHVMQWAGYSRDKKVAYLEFMLERDGRLDEFKSRIPEVAKGKSWETIHDQPLMIKSVASKLASEFYPEIWPDSKAFNEIVVEEAERLDDRVEQMLEVVRRRRGNPDIVFILDEVGHYIANREDARKDLDGLARNIKNIGRGHAWIIATAQQTLTEDDPRAQHNTARLFMLKDRFPIPVDLEASDIKEIVWRRLLSKSPAGEQQLRQLFGEKGQSLRFATELENTRLYKSNLDEETFCRLYPFLPQHFDILLNLLGRLARTSGGSIGLRSAIKVIQDVLVSTDGGHMTEGALGDRPVGTLATTVTFFDSLRHDIQRSFRHLVEGVEKVERACGADSTEARAAKTVAVLQILEDLPASAANVAALSHSSVDGISEADQYKAALEELEKDAAIPLGRFDGNYRFLSEAVAGIEQQKAGIQVKTVDCRAVRNGRLKEVFGRPSARLQGVRTVNAGVKVYAGSFAASLLGDREPVQIYVAFVGESEYEAKRKERILESSQRQNNNSIFLIAREDPELDDLAAEIFRCQTIHSQNRSRSVEKDVDEYLRGQLQRAENLGSDLSRRLAKALNAGSFIFRGEQRAVSELGGSFEESLKKELATAVDRIYEKYSEAPVQADSTLAEHFLKTEKLNRIASKDDPLGLVKPNGSIDTDKKCLVSFNDYLEQRGAVDGRKILDDFYAPPCGWSKDTTRYLTAALLTAGKLKLRISGDDVTVRGPASVEALKNTNNFNKITVSLASNIVDPVSLLRASQRLLDLTGETVNPLPHEISRAVMKSFPDLQQDYAAIETQLRHMDLPGQERARGLQEAISQSLKGDASDAPARLGGEDCPFFDHLVWARKLKKAFDNGIEKTVAKARRLQDGIEALPAHYILDALKVNTRQARDEMTEVLSQHDFFELRPKLEQGIQAAETIVAKAVIDFRVDRQSDLEKSKKRITESDKWRGIGEEDEARLKRKLEGLSIPEVSDLDGIQRILTGAITVSSTITQVEREVNDLYREVEAAREAEKVEKVAEDEADYIPVPKEIASIAELDELIDRLVRARKQLELGKKILLRS